MCDLWPIDRAKRQMITHPPSSRDCWRALCIVVDVLHVVVACLDRKIVVSWVTTSGVYIGVLYTITRGVMSVWCVGCDGSIVVLAVLQWHVCVSRAVGVDGVHKLWTAVEHACLFVTSTCGVELGVLCATHAVE